MVEPAAPEVPVYPKLLLSLSIMAAPKPAEPTGTQLVISFIVGAGIVFYIGYGIYCRILKQMAINAKNKRIIKNQVTYWTGREYRRSRRN